MKLLMGERLYGDPMVALRELLQNSVDAIRHRENVELRAGNTFQPKITIELVGNRLVVEDNGMGMDENILKNYFTQIGRSYYSSPEFRIQHLDMDTVSEFGIGILSLFMIADYFEVESRRRSEEMDAVPGAIHLEVPSAYDYFVLHSSSHPQVGTRITAHLKQNHALSLDDFYNTISRIALFVEFPIEIITEQGSRLFNPCNSIDDVKAKALSVTSVFPRDILFDIPLDSPDTISMGVQGICQITGKSSSRDFHTGIEIKNVVDPNITIEGMVYQRGFLVGRSVRHPMFAQTGRSLQIMAYDMPHQNLFPLWTQCRVFLNLSGQSALNLSPNRFDIVEDEKFVKVRETLDDLILGGFRKHLLEKRDNLSPSEYYQYVLELQDSWALRLLSDWTPQYREFIMDLIPIACINSLGEIDTCFGRDIVNSPKVAYLNICNISQDITHQIRSDFDTYCSGIPILLFHMGMNVAKLTWTYSLFLQENAFIYPQPNAVYISSVPGVVVDILDRQERGHRLLFGNEGYYTFDITTQKHHTPIFAYRVVSHSVTLMVNRSHPLIAPFVVADTARPKFLSDILRKIGSISEDMLGHYLETHQDEAVHTHPPQNNPNQRMMGVLKQRPEYIERFQEGFQGIWEEARAQNVIPSALDFPGVTENDFPWFWSWEPEEA